MNNSVTAPPPLRAYPRRSAKLHNQTHLKMELRTDALGVFESPDELTIRKVIEASEDMPRGYFINLEKDINNYLSLSIGERNEGHSLTLKNKSLKVKCCKKINNDEAIEIFNRYLNGDLSWYGNYEWKQTTMSQILENIEWIQQREAEQNSGDNSE